MGQYQRNTWLARIGTGLNRWRDTISNTLFNFVNEATSVSQEGTPFQAAWMNNLESGVETNSLRTAYNNTIGGTGDAITITTGTVTGFTFSVGESIRGVIGTTNTGAVTCTVDSGTTYPVRKIIGNAFQELVANDLVENTPFEFICTNDGTTDFFLQAPRGGAGTPFLIDEQVEVALTTGVGVLDNIQPIKPLYNEADVGIDYVNFQITGTGTTKGATGIHLVADAQNDSAMLPTNLKPSSLYAMIINVRNVDLDDNWGLATAGVQVGEIILSKNLGLNVLTFTTDDTITSNQLRFFTFGANTDTRFVDFEIYGIYEIETVSEANNPLFLENRPFGFIEPPPTIEITAMGKNFYNNRTSTTGILSTSTGQFTPGDSAIVSDFIPVIPSSIVTYTIDNSNYIINGHVLYDSNKNYIRFGNFVNHQIPSNACFARVSFRREPSAPIDLTEINDVFPQYEYNSSRTSYEPYQERTINQTLPTDTRHVELPNGVGNSQENGVFDKNVERRLIQASDLSNFDNSSKVNFDFIRLNYSMLPNSAIDTSSFQNSIIAGFEEINTANSFIADESSFVGQYSTFISQAGIIIGLEKGLYANLAAAQAGLENTVMYYELDIPLTATEGQPFEVELPNGVKNVYDADAEELTENVASITLQSADIASWGIFPGLDNAQIIDITKPADYILNGNAIRTLENSQTVLIANIEPSADFVVQNDLSILVNRFSNAWGIQLPANTYSSLSEAQADWAGRTIYYQKATPTTTPLTDPELFTIDTNVLESYENGQYLFNRDSSAGSFLVPPTTLNIANNPDPKIPTIRTFVDEPIQSFEVAPGAMLGRGNFFSLDTSDRATPLSFSTKPDRIGYTPSVVIPISIHIPIDRKRVLEISPSISSDFDVRLRGISFNGTFTDGTTLEVSNQAASLNYTRAIKVSPTRVVIYYTRSFTIRRAILNIEDDEDNISTLTLIDESEIFSTTNQSCELVLIKENEYILFYRNTSGVNARIETLNSDDTVTAKTSTVLFSTGGGGFGGSDSLSSVSAKLMQENKILCAGNSTGSGNTYTLAVLTIDDSSIGFSSGTVKTESGRLMGSLEKINDTSFVIGSKVGASNVQGAMQIGTGEVDLTNNTVGTISYTNLGATGGTNYPIVGKVKEDLYYSVFLSGNSTAQGRGFNIDESSFAINFETSGNQLTTVSTLFAQAYSYNPIKLTDNILSIPLSSATGTVNTLTIFIEADFTIAGLTSEDGTAGDTINCFVPSFSRELTSGAGAGKFFSFNDSGQIQEPSSILEDSLLDANLSNIFYVETHNISQNRFIEFRGQQNTDTSVAAIIRSIDSEGNTNAGTSVQIDSDLSQSGLARMIVLNSTRAIAYYTSLNFTDVRRSIITFSDDDTDTSTIASINNTAVFSGTSQWIVNLQKIDDNRYMVFFRGNTTNIQARIETLNSDDTVTLGDLVTIQTVAGAGSITSLDHQIVSTTKLDDNHIIVSYQYIDTPNFRVRQRLITLDNSSAGFSVSSQTIDIANSIVGQIQAIDNTRFVFAVKSAGVDSAGAVSLIVGTVNLDTGVITHSASQSIGLTSNYGSYVGKLINNLFMVFGTNSAGTSTSFGRSFEVDSSNNITFSDTGNELPAIGGNVNILRFQVLTKPRNNILCFAPISTANTTPLIFSIGSTVIDGLTIESGNDGDTIDCFIP